jgi:hypothetical protein
LLAVLILTVVSASASATTIHVPSGQPTIQQGIDAAAGGDTVLVAADTYTGALNRDLDFGGTNIVLLSESGLDLTIIDCQGSGRGFYFHSGEDTTAVVSGFTIANAVADSGAGAYCVAGSSPRFESCKFLESTAQMRGGGLCCDASSPIVRGCQFVRNVAVEGARDNGYGGGIACLSGSSPLIVDTVFSENEARYAGGGLWAQNAWPEVARCQFLANRIVGYGNGAGVGLVTAHGTSVTECAFYGNGVSTCVGGGLHASSSIITVSDCDFRDNISGASGGMHMTGAVSSTVTGCTFVGNVGGWTAAGGLQCVFGANPIVTNCTFAGNDYSHVWLDTASPTFEYCIFAFSADGPAVYCENETETPDINHCFVYGNAAGDTLCGGNFSDIEYADPRFCDVENGDVDLCEDSPCLPGATWPELVGSRDSDCSACGSAVEEHTWGRIKATYR